jgi:hypothetical protein
VSEEKSNDLNDLIKRFWQLEVKDVDEEQHILSKDDSREKRIHYRPLKNVCFTKSALCGKPMT